MSAPRILAHRLFPGFAALWFAALFGLGSMAASNAALGSLVVHLGLPAIVPAAAPPLGLTARVLLVLLLTGLGAMLGLAIGVVLYKRAGGIMPVRAPRPVVTPAPKAEAEAMADNAPRVRSRDAHPDAPPRRPLVVTEDVLPYPTTFGPQDAALAEPELPIADLASLDELPPFLAAAFAATRPAEVPVFVAPAEPIIVPALDEPEAIAPEPEPVVAEPVVAAAIVAAPAPVAQVSRPPLASLAAAAPKVSLGEVPLDSLGLVQLIERLALAIATRQTRRADLAHADQIAAVDPDMPLHRQGPLALDPAAPLLRAKPSRTDRPEAFISEAEVAYDHFGDEPFEADHQGDAAVTADFVADHDDGEDAETAQDRYSSLADMALRRPAMIPHQPVQLVDADRAEVAAVPDPVVPFPQRLGGADARRLPVLPEAAPGDADRALRDALATLRRMSAGR